MGNEQFGAKNTGPVMHAAAAKTHRLRDGTLALITGVTVLKALGSFQPLYANEPSGSGALVSFYQPKFFLGSYIAFESGCGKFSNSESMSAMDRSLDETKGMLDTLKCRYGQARMPQNDGEAIALGKAVRNTINRMFSKKPNRLDSTKSGRLNSAEFVLESFIKAADSAASDCDTRAAIGAQLFTFYGLDSAYFVIVPATTPDGAHCVLEIDTWWGSRLYFDMTYPNEGYDQAWFDKFYSGRTLGRVPIEPGNLHSAHLKAVECMKAGQTDKAISELGKIIEKDSTYVLAYLSLAECYFDKGKYHEALDQLDKAEKLAPDFGMIGRDKETVKRELAKREAINRLRRPQELP